MSPRPKWSRRVALSLIAAVHIGGVGGARLAWAGEGRAADEGARAAGASLMAPPAPLARGRVSMDVRPFFNLLGSGWGLIGGVFLEHRPWSAPLKLTAGLTPVAATIDGRANRAVLHARLGAAFTTRFLELGIGAGSRVQDFGGGGFSLAAGLRMGAIDGLSARIDLTYVVVRNYYTGQTEIAFSNLLTSLEVPVHPAAALIVEGGVGLDAWLFATIGLKHHLGPRGEPGTWSVRGGLGIVWTNDECLYMDPRPCEGSTWAAGPTLSVGVDRRF